MYELQGPEGQGKFQYSPSKVYNDESYSVKKHDPIHVPTASTGTWSVNIRRASSRSIFRKDRMESQLVWRYMKKLRRADQVHFRRS